MMRLEKDIEPISLVHMNMKWTMLNRIQDVQQKKKFRNRTDTINYLLDLAIKFLDKVESVPPDKLNSELDEIHNQLKEAGVVDYVSKMNGRDLKNLYKIISEEYHYRTEK